MDYGERHNCERFCSCLRSGVEEQLELLDRAGYHVVTRHLDPVKLGFPCKRLRTFLGMPCVTGMWHMCRFFQGGQFCCKPRFFFILRKSLCRGYDCRKLANALDAFFARFQRVAPKEQLDEILNAADTLVGRARLARTSVCLTSCS